MKCLMIIVNRVQMIHQQVIQKNRVQIIHQQVIQKKPGTGKPAINKPSADKPATGSTNKPLANKPAAKKAAKTSDQSATAAFIVLFLAGVSMAGASRLRRSRKQS